MSTRCNIYLKVSEETKGKTIKFNKNLLPDNEQHVLNYSIPDMKVPKNAQYLGVYCHHDGYINGVGKELIENYDTEEKILNLLCMGDLSNVCQGVSSYESWRNENNTEAEVIDETCERIGYSWGDENKCEEKRIPAIVGGKLSAEWALKEEYAYLFDGDNWFVAYSQWNDSLGIAIFSGWKSLANLLYSIEHKSPIIDEPFENYR